MFAFNWLSHRSYKTKVCLICDLLSSDFQRLRSNTHFNLERKILNQQLINGFKTAYDCNPFHMIAMQFGKAWLKLQMTQSGGDYHKDIVN